MKVFMKLFLTIAALIMGFAACSASTDPYTGTLASNPATTTTTTTTTAKSAAYNYSYSFSGNYTKYNSYISYKRAIADYFYYNDFVTTFVACKTTDSWGDCSEYYSDSYATGGSKGCAWGYAVKYGDDIGDGSCMSDDYLKSYWSYNQLLLADTRYFGTDMPMEVFSPKAYNLKPQLDVTFSVDLDPNQNIVKSGASLSMSFTTDTSTFDSYYSRLQRPMTITGGHIVATFADRYNCGTVKFEGDVVSGNVDIIRNVKVTYYNSASSYINKSCYYYSSYPGNASGNNVIYSYNGNSGILFDTLTLTLPENPLP
jgi:hypothetical protein